MGLKTKSRVSAEFSMSSLTDIIFLLLIFFMLTSSMVVPNALNLKLPGKKASTVKVNSTPPMITIEHNGTFYLNGVRISKSALVKAVRAEKKKNKSKATIQIKPNPNASNEHVVYVMDLAYRFGIQAVMARY